MSIALRSADARARRARSDEGATSGSRGMHVNVRIEPRWTFAEVRRSAGKREHGRAPRPPRRSGPRPPLSSPPLRGLRLSHGGHEAGRARHAP
ncbi:MAG: hypothetical protein FJ144_13615 [Deltaproteobacteria bacterium]|nr:hypothetical protein [Deltaproteobacteria bacterium]